MFFVCLSWTLKSLPQNYIQASWISVTMNEGKTLLWCLISFRNKKDIRFGSGLKILIYKIEIMLFAHRVVERIYIFLIPIYDIKYLVHVSIQYMEVVIILLKMSHTLLGNTYTTMCYVKQLLCMLLPS